MAAVKKFGVPLDLNKYEIRNVKAQKGLPDGLADVDAGLYALDADGALRVWSGTTWGLKATDSELFDGHAWSEVAGAVTASADSINSAWQAGDNALRTEINGKFNDAVAATTADHASIRADFAAADTAVRGEFAAADTQVRQEFAAADQTVTTAFQAADAALRANLTASIETTRADLNAADASIRTDFTAADTALDATLRQYVDNLQGTTSAGTTAALEGLRTEVEAADASLRTDLEAGDTAARAYADQLNAALSAALQALTTSTQQSLTDNLEFARDRANHTGTQSADTIVDFEDAVRRHNITQFADPDTALNMANHRIVNVADPRGPQEVATKNYVDVSRQGLRQKEAVQVATAGEPLLLDGTDIEVDAYELAAGDRVLVKDQDDSTQNGIYVVVTDGPWVRAADASTAEEITDGAQVWVREGTTNSDTSWAQVNPVDNLELAPNIWVQQGKALRYTAGRGLYIDETAGSGGEFNLRLGGTLVTSGYGNLNVNTQFVSTKFTGLFAGGADFEVINHNLGTRGVVVQIYQNGGDYDQIEFGVERTTENSVTVRFGEAITAESFGFVVLG